MWTEENTNKAEEILVDAGSWYDDALDKLDDARDSLHRAARVYKHGGEHKLYRRLKADIEKLEELMEEIVLNNGLDLSDV